METENENDNKPWCFLEGTIGYMYVRLTPQTCEEEEGEISISFSVIPSAEFVSSTKDGEQTIFAKDADGKVFPLSSKGSVAFDTTDPPGQMLKSFLLELKNNQNKIRVLFYLEEKYPNGWFHDSVDPLVAVL